MRLIESPLIFFSVFVVCLISNQESYTGDDFRQLHVDIVPDLFQLLNL